MFTMYNKFNFLLIGWGDTGQLIRFENIVQRYEMGQMSAGGLF